MAGRYSMIAAILIQRDGFEDSLYKMRASLKLPCPMQQHRTQEPATCALGNPGSWLDPAMNSLARPHPPYRILRCPGRTVRLARRGQASIERRTPEIPRLRSTLSVETRPSLPLPLFSAPEATTLVNAARHLPRSESNGRRAGPASTVHTVDQRYDQVALPYPAVTLFRGVMS